MSDAKMGAAIGCAQEALREEQARLMKVVRETGMQACAIRHRQLGEAIVLLESAPQLLAIARAAKIWRHRSRTLRSTDHAIFDAAVDLATTVADALANPALAALLK